MTDIKSLKKRSWDPVVDIESGRWYTGFIGDIYKTFGRDSGKYHVVKGGEHEIRRLTLKLKYLYRGRSAAGFVFEDVEGFSYNIGMKGTSKILTKLLENTIDVEYGYITTDFIQTKQGQNIFIEPLE